MSGSAQAADKPNILVIMTDDVGIPNISAYSHGMMGYQTPNIDRIAKGRCVVHRLLRGTELHGGPLGFYYRAAHHSHGPFESRVARRR